MRTMRHNTGSQKFINEIQLARLRVAQAESKWELADEQAREARRRRKEARQAARRAKKHARQAKEEFAVAKQALVALEGKFAAAVERAVRNRKQARARLAAARRHKKTGGAESPAVLAKKIVPVTEGQPAGAAMAQKNNALPRRSPSRRTNSPPAVVPAAETVKSGPRPRDLEVPPGTIAILPAGPPPLNPEPRTSPRL